MPCTDNTDCVVDEWCVVGQCAESGYCRYDVGVTCDDGDQAHARSGLPTVSAPAKGNKGVEGAVAALEMVSLVGSGGLVWEA